MLNTLIMTLKFNVDDYPYDYELEIWKNIPECRCLNITFPKKRLN
jgi:hypothetical protein